MPPPPRSATSETWQPSTCQVLRPLVQALLCKRAPLLPPPLVVGAMSVFTTRSLLSSLGVANKRSSEAAAAINWVVKDGAGRLGRFLFARW